MGYGVSLIHTSAFFYSKASVPLFIGECNKQAYFAGYSLSRFGDLSKCKTLGVLTGTRDCPLPTFFSLSLHSSSDALNISLRCKVIIQSKTKFRADVTL